MPLSRYRRAVGLLAALTLGVLLGALVAMHWVRSPQQALLDRSAPPLTPLTATVERRVVRSTVILRAQVRPQRSFDVVPAASAGTTALVSAVKVRAGQSVSAGQVLVEVAGRPIILLQGNVPAFRDLSPGDSGKDVAQLQTALRTLGIAGLRSDGHYGATTKAAVAKLYARAGYDPVVHGDPATLQSAHAQVVSARRALTDAQVALARARDDARQPVAGASATAPADVPANTPANAQANTPANAQANAVADARRQVTYARQDLRTAVASEREAQRTGGAELPQAEVVFVPSLPARVQSTKAAVGAAATTPLLTLASGSLVATGTLSASQHAAVRVGMATQLISDVNGATLEGRVAAVGQRVQNPETGDSGYPVTVAARKPIPGDWAGEDVRLSVQSAGSGDPVLAVPFSAVYAGSNGAAHVLKVASAGNASGGYASGDNVSGDNVSGDNVSGDNASGDSASGDSASGGERASVPVTTGVSGDGYVEITPAGGALSPGDRVIVGQGRPAATPGADPSTAPVSPGYAGAG